MIAFELVKEAGGNTPDAETTAKLVAKARENGLILLSCGYWGNTIRLLAPITVPDAQLEEALAIIEKSLAEIGAA